MLYTGNRRVEHRKTGGMYSVLGQEDSCTQETRRLYKEKRRFVLRKKKGCTQETGCTQEARRLCKGKQEESTVYPGKLIVVHRKQEGCTTKAKGLHSGLYTGNRRVVHRKQ